MPITIEDLRSRAAPWTAAVPGVSPAGAVATQEPAYQAVRGEIEKLASPAGGQVNWKAVSEQAGSLLQTRCKDLYLAAVLAHSFHVANGAEGLTSGAVLLADLMDQYWESMQPSVKRLRARLNTLEWFLERTQLLLDGLEEAPPGTTLEQAEALELAVRHLADVARARLPEPPAFSPILEVAERWKKTAAPPPPPPEPPPEVAAAPAAATAEQPPSVPATAPAAAPAELANPADTVEYLRSAGNALAASAATLRLSDASDPTAYRLLRTGLWLHLLQAPPAAGGRTQVRPLPEQLRNQLALLHGNGRWAVLVEECESALPGNRFALDLQRLCWQGLASLGAAHERAREAVAAEVRSLLVRLPQLSSLSFADGSPFADAQTRTWLEEALASVRGGGRSTPPAGESDAAKALAEAQHAFAEGPNPDSLARMHDAALSARTPRERFVLRVEVGRACLAASFTAVAKALFAELVREASEHRLDDWEPALAAAPLKGLIATTRALAKDPRGADVALVEHYQRLCRLDPAAAIEAWP